MSSASQKVHEPSMEEILASIRRIIADDQEAMQDGHTAEPPLPSSPLRNVLDLAERQTSLPSASIAAVPEDDPVEEVEGAYAAHDETRQRSSASSAGVYRIEQYPPGAFPLDEPGPVPATAPVSVRPAAPQPRQSERPARDSVADSVEDALLSSESDASVFDAFARLGASLPASAPKTLEDIVKEMLRPMLKAWLDDNLPALVERLVQAEIERVTRGKR